ncbi:MAG: hypothetical protein FJY75_06970 [Candidatus Eisenbacteria bacterium]|uniref:Uncharacterized protein n=1 Tax=Eiseniibacteriota bacterium TaxID=2212470 RepID=A0A938BM18_UNCEI|nr:hypothetical protein [Candidatus Eisenbacteria bacterium]
MSRFIRFVETFNSLDKRWIFLAVGVAVVTATIFRLTFPEIPTPMVRAIYDKVETLPVGSRVLLPFDYDPGSEPELQPMADAFVRQCAEKGLKMYFIALWPLGQSMVEGVINRVLLEEYPQLRYGEDYVDLGYKSGGEGVIAVILTDLKKLYTTDARGTNIEAIPMMAGIANIRGFDLILNVSAGYPGLKEWIQYAGTPGNIPTAGGCTAVQAPLLYPYHPDQMLGLMGGIKAAAEYEALMMEGYPKFAENKARYLTALTRMGPQTVAHLAIIFFIVAGNVAYQIMRRRKGAAR